LDKTGLAAKLLAAGPVLNRQARAGGPALQALDWDDLDAVDATNHKALTALADSRQTLRHLLETVRHTPALLDLCEHYDILDKLVLHNDSSHGFRIRMHVFLPSYFDRPHNHRWSYSSRILHGSYKHTLYGHDDGLTDQVDVAQLKPLLVRTERPGSRYTLHHAMIHSVVAEPYTVSLIIRGPACKQRFLVMDKTTTQAWWQYGADEPPEVADQKRTTTARFDATVAKLVDIGIVSALAAE